MKIESMRVFISYSHVDAHIASLIADALRRSGVEVWIYDTQIALGDEIVNKVEHALDTADFILVLLSRASICSAWVRREVASRLMTDLAEGRDTIIPVLIDDVPVPSLLKSVRWADFRSSIQEGLNQLNERFHGPLELNVNPHSTFEVLYFLLLIDQFPNGIWGASLEDSADLYGHRGDPGSISVSTFSALAITRFTGSRTSPPIQAFRAYLQSRQSELGAFGMKRDVGTAKFPKPEILEHSRHTATALSFFLFYDGYDYGPVQLALEYLLDVRTPDGLWVDFGPRISGNTDPITVAFVVSVLEEVQSALSRRVPTEQEVVRSKQIDEAILLGLDYLFTSPLRSEEGFWFYRFGTDEDKKRVLQNLYQYTTDVISSVVLSCQRLDRYLDELNDILRKLFLVVERYNGGLPRSPASNVPNLDATGRLIASARFFTHLSKHAKSLFDHLPELCADSDVLTSGCANGWSSILLLYGSPEAPFGGRRDDRIDSINKAARELRGGNPDTVTLPSYLEPYSSLVRNMLRRHKLQNPL